MLMRLIRHELRATGRTMLPLLGLLVLSALGANFSIRSLNASPQPLLRLLGSVLPALFAVALVGVVSSALTSSVRRFHSNLLQDEGYLMMTLPVSVHQHIWCKLLVPAFWFVLTAATAALSVHLTVRDVRTIQQLWRNAQEGYAMFFSDTSLDRFFSALTSPGVLWMLGSTVLLGALCLCLQCYAAMAVGHSFSGRKSLYSVGLFFLMGLAIQFVGMGCKEIWQLFGLWQRLMAGPGTMKGAAAMMANLGLVMTAEVLYAAVFYTVTAIFLKRRLNLD